MVEYYCTSLQSCVADCRSLFFVHDDYRLSWQPLRTYSFRNVKQGMNYFYHIYRTHHQSQHQQIERVHFTAQVMSHDALRMRLRRLCEIKPRTKKCHVDSETHEQWKQGGESREWLEIALAEAVERLGTEKNHHKKLRAPWCQGTVDLGV